MFQGNEFFRDGWYDSAIQCYTRGMDADPYNPVLPTNRAACFFRLNKYSLVSSVHKGCIYLIINTVKTVKYHYNLN
uniref:Tetratricopeptide repeat domain 32 n=1 Tax=Sinocyclocheilus rhinocerous TaxID=307959 RepID=A0A673G3H1_9TELE